MASEDENSESTSSLDSSQDTAPSGWSKLWRSLSSRSTRTQDSPKKVNQRPWQWENLQTILIAVILALLIRVYVAESRFIPSTSMLPTLQLGDRVVVEKLSSYFHPPRFGDIVVFHPPEALQTAGYAANQAFIKRIIGTPGQMIRVDRGNVYVDGQRLAEPYIAEPPNYKWGPWQVPDHAFFVMGDNRNNSNDSHIWGFLPDDHVIGRAWFRFWPLGRIGPV